MAAYTSVQNGNWNDPATWGGSGYPSVAGDTAAIGHIVTYNVSSTTQLGQITINNGGLLVFSVTMNTLLTLGHADILINNGGELRVGLTGAVIPAAYTAKVKWATTSDNAKGLNIQNGGILNIYGDPTYYGSKFDYILATQVVIPATGNSVAITIQGNYAGNFQAGQELLVHKGGDYAHYINDFCRLAVVSATNNGANTDISCTVTERPGSSLTCLVGADVLNVSRNVILNLLNYNANLGQLNSNRPRTANSGIINANDCLWGGWNTALAGSYLTTNNIVVRNGNFAIYTCYVSQFNNIIYFSNSRLINIYNTVLTGYVCANSVYGVQSWYTSETPGPLKIYGNNNFGLYDSIDLNVKDCYIYSNNRGVQRGFNSQFMGGGLSYDANGINKNNGTDIDTGSGGGKNWVFLNTKTPDPPALASRTYALYGCRLAFEHYLQQINQHYIYDNFGDIQKVLADGSGSLPNQRSGGSQYVQQVTPQSSCGSVSYLEIFKVRVWAAAGVAKTYKFYIQNNFGMTLGDSDIALFAEYLDNNPAGSGHSSKVQSSGVSIAQRSNQSDWSQSISVTVTPQADGWVTLYLRLTNGTSASLWVDPQLEVS